MLSSRTVGNGSTPVPDSWRTVKLGDVARVETGGTPSRATPEYWGGDIPWMASGEVNQRRVRFTAERITEAGLNCSNAKVFEPGATMIALNGQGRTRGLAAYLEIAAACNQSLAAVSPMDGLVDRFLFHNLEGRYGELRALTGDDARTGLNLKLIRGLSLLLPEVSEQRAIAAVLDAIDEAIEKTEAVIAATERLRAALLYELLTRGVVGWHREWKHVPGIGKVPACWEVVRLGSVAEVVAGFALGPDRRPRARPTPYLTVANVSAGRIEVDEPRFMEVSPNEYETRRLAAGDLVMVEGHAQVSQLGRAAIVPHRLEGYTFQNHLFRVRGNRTLCLNAYLCLHINGWRGRDYFRSFAGTTSGLNTVSTANVKSMRLPVPGRDEQQLIVDMDADLQTCIERGRKAKVCLQMVKSTLAEALLTGDVRVPARGQAIV